MNRVKIQHFKKFLTFVNWRTERFFSFNLRYRLNMDLNYCKPAALATLATEHVNQLIHEKSPYLLQHSKNPVNWYPWGNEAICKAKSENKLIFLSVGYSTCHWCHVMEKECFENEDIALVMNENFVNIKVDREERPDVDKMYMTFIQLTSGSAGWPMSVFLTPELHPVAGGTYFPPEDKWGRPGFKTVLHKLSKKWKEDSQQLREIGEKLITALGKASVFECSIVDKLTKGAVPDDECVSLCAHQLSRHFDEDFGGFEIAPKFPQPSNMMFLFHYYSRNIHGSQNKMALGMALKTLKKMSKGGIHDHIGQGFARYSTDEKWHVPHFEKMLYDQAQLAVAYSVAYLITKEKLYRDIIIDILTYVDRDLSHELGGFYSAEDADSLPTPDAAEKVEGAFYVWKFDEIEHLLSQPLRCKSNIVLSDVFCHHYNVKKNGNVDPHDDPHKNFVDQNVLIVYGNENKTAEEFNITVDELTNELEIARKILFEERNKRPRPHLDNKIITSWNGLMLSGFAKASQILQNNEYKSRAIKSALFIKKYLYLEGSGELLHCCYVDENQKNIVQIANPVRGFLNDYAFLIRGLLDLYECTSDGDWIQWCERLQDVQNNLFWDTLEKAYNLGSSNDHFVLLKQKEDHDGAEPSGNSVAVQNLLRLSVLLDRSDYNEKAKQIFSVFTSRLTQFPQSLPEMVSGLMFYHDSPTLILIAENNDKENAKQMLKTIHTYYIPNRILLIIDNDPSSTFCSNLDVVKNLKGSVGNIATAYVCKNQICSLPVTTIESLKALLSQ